MHCSNGTRAAGERNGPTRYLEWATDGCNQELQHPVAGPFPWSSLVWTGVSALRSQRCCSKIR
jgi:hypothetical protein